MDEHNTRVSSLATQIQDFYTRKIPFRCYHGSTTSTRKVTYTPETSIDLSPFTGILSVDPARSTALVEPNVSMAALVKATLPHNMVPAVVPEFTTITVGGCFAGTGGESSSFRHGVFDDTVLSIEIVLGDGTVTKASETENADLWRGAAGSFGSLGVVTLLEIRLVRAERFVEVEYVPVRSAGEAVEVMRGAEGREDVGYLDGVLFGEEKGVVMLGRWEAGNAGSEGVRFTRRGDDWFYMHAQKVTERLLEGELEERKEARDSLSTIQEEKGVARTHKELVPTYDYLFRWDRACFWMGQHALDYFYVHNIRFSRWLGDSLLRPAKMMHAGQKAGLMNQYVVQDISIPYQHVGEFVSYIQKEIGIYPLWLCPLLLKHQWPLKPNDPTIPERIMNVGMWGPGSKKLAKFVQQNRDLEEKTRQLHGLKCLYAQAFYTEEEFWRVYDRERYDTLRTKYRAETLPTVYDKTCKNSATQELEKRRTSSSEKAKGYVKDFWICRGLYGAASSMLGGDYLMRKAKAA
ncbi:FAD-binding domain-containing protein 63 [Elsinoe fawcettii]|nr:FAD-binding domain-containing protein 63 [Elsinoe fawcettii]